MTKIDNMSIPTCRDCGQPMIEVGGTGKQISIDEFRDTPGSEYKGLVNVGIREQKLYQCPECKEVALQ